MLAAIVLVPTPIVMNVFEECGSGVFPPELQDDIDYFEDRHMVFLYIFTPHVVAYP